jgi:hypothetical protein
MERLSLERRYVEEVLGPDVREDFISLPKSMLMIVFENYCNPRLQRSHTSATIQATIRTQEASCIPLATTPFNALKFRPNAFKIVGATCFVADLLGNLGLLQTWIADNTSHLTVIIV